MVLGHGERRAGGRRNELRLTDAPTIRIEERIERDRLYQWLERTWMAQQLLPAFVFYAVGGWAFVVWGVCARITAGVFGHWLIGYFAHNHGPMHVHVSGAAVQGRNIPWTSLMTMGECWHNNHHAFPGSAKLGLHAGEWDPGWWALTVLRKAGLVWSLRLPDAMPKRPELRALDRLGSASMTGERKECASPAMGVRAVFDLCVRPDLHAGSCSMEGPATTLSARCTQALIGNATRFRRVEVASRLSIRVGEHIATGLPALCIAIARRNLALRIVGMCAAPAAVGFESARRRLRAA